MNIPTMSTRLTAMAHSTYSVAMSETAFTRLTSLLLSFKIIGAIFTLQAYIDRGKRIFKIDDVFTFTLESEEFENFEKVACCAALGMYVIDHDNH